MNFNNFTIKSQEAVQEAVNLVKARGQQAIEPVHLLTGRRERYQLHFSKVRSKRTTDCIGC